ncbi:hypothetical protein Tco_1123806 [Tanacetum coccineum]|uniref:Uncharacterized protein n=1 Tax=Tanacetum coccineum TaxID=301880 RepID=A0ABQ5J4E0_9ASTR
MAVLESCPKHNMVAYLEKTKGNAEFHEVIDFLTRSSIHHALTVSLVVSTSFVEQFWMSAKSKIINNVRYITAKVAGKPVSISEASIRSDLLFDDVDGIDSLPNQAIFDAIQLMGYEGDLTPQSDPSPRPSPTPHIPDSILEVSGGNQGGQSSSDRSLSGTEDGMTLQSVYDLCISLCTQVTDQAKEIKNLKAQIKKLKKQAKPVITHHKGRKSAKAESSVHKDPLFDELDDDEIDNMDTEDAQDVGRSRDVVNEEKENVMAEVRRRAINQLPSTNVYELMKTIAQVLLNEPKPKQFQRKGEGPLLKIDPKDKGKKKNEEEDGLNTESEIKRSDEDFIAIGSVEDERRIKEMNEGVKDTDQKILKEENIEKLCDNREEIVIARLGQEMIKVIYGVSKDWKIITWRLYEACGVCIMELEDGIVIYMLVERRYPLSKELWQRMLDLGLEVERESSVALAFNKDL